MLASSSGPPGRSWSDQGGDFDGAAAFSAGEDVGCREQDYSGERKRNAHYAPGENDLPARVPAFHPVFRSFIPRHPASARTIPSWTTSFLGPQRVRTAGICHAVPSIVRHRFFCTCAFATLGSPTPRSRRSLRRRPRLRPLRDLACGRHRRTGRPRCVFRRLWRPPRPNGHRPGRRSRPP